MEPVVSDASTAKALPENPPLRPIIRASIRTLMSFFPLALAISLLSPAPLLPFRLASHGALGFSAKSVTV